MRRKTYSEKDCEEVISSIKRGSAFLSDIEKEYMGREGRFIVCLFSNDQEVNKLTLEYLPVLGIERNISVYIIITPYPEIRDMVENNCRVRYILKHCSNEDMSDFCNFFYSIYNYIYKLDRRKVIINGVGNNKEDRLWNYLGINGISKRDIVALALFWFRYVPDEKEIKVAADRVIDVKDNIDWNKYSVMQQTETLSFPDSVYLGVKYILDQGQIRKKDKIVLFSKTKTSESIISFLDGFDIIAVLDNNASLSGELCGGIDVSTPEEFFSKKDLPDIKIIVPTRSYKAICEQLYEYGYYPGEQVFVTYVENSWSNGIRDDVTEIEEDFRNGKRIYENIREKYPDERLYFLTFPGIGDTYLMCMYLSDRMKYDGVSNAVLILINESCRRVYSLLEHNTPIEDVYVIGNNSDAMSLLLFIKQIGYEKLNVCNLTHSFDLLDPGNLRGYKGLDFNTVFQKVVFHSDIKRNSIGVRKKRADEIFEQNGIRMGKTVLLSPYAKSARKLKESTWRLLVENLLNNGYDVCTNVSSDEKPIEGTKGLFIPFEQIIDFVEKAGVFIGIRSGLCDLLSHANAKKIILYSGVKNLYSDFTFSFFGLENMGIADNKTSEIIIEDEDVIKDIIREVESQ